MSSNYRFKKSYLDPKNGDIELHYICSRGTPICLQTNARQSEHIWTRVDEELNADANERIKELLKD